MKKRMTPPIKNFHSRVNGLYFKKQMKNIILVMAILVLGPPIHAQTFELKNGRSMCMLGKGPGQDATINPYFGQDAYAIIQNVGAVVFGVRIESQTHGVQEITIQPKEVCKLLMTKNSILYFDAIEKDIATAQIHYVKD